MEIDSLRAELERLFELEELVTMSRDLLGFEPEAIGGTAGIGSFARALTDHCVEHDALEALCDAVVASKSGASPDVAALGARGLPRRTSSSSEIGSALISSRASSARAPRASRTPRGATTETSASRCSAGKRRATSAR